MNRVFVRGAARKRAYPLFLVAWLAAGAFGLAACNGDPFGGDQVAEEEFFFEIDATGRSIFRLDGINGNIDVVADEDATTVTAGGFRRVRSSSRSDAEEQLERLTVEVRAVGNAIEIFTDQPSDTQGRSFEVEYDLIVPPTLEGDVRNVNGNIMVSALEDDLDVFNVNGNITLVDQLGSTTATVTNGNIVAEVTLPQGGEIDFNATNGNLELDIPQNTSATFSARLANGTITTSNLSLNDAQSTTVSLTGVLGDGDGSIDLDTVNGNITARGF